LDIDWLPGAAVLRRGLLAINRRNDDINALPRLRVHVAEPPVVAAMSCEKAPVSPQKKFAAAPQMGGGAAREAGYER